MTTFAQATTQTPVIRETNNGMKTLLSSLSECVNLFFAIGASRGKDITAMFERAYQEDRVTALRILAWSRDVRGGAGERSTYRALLKFIESNHPQEIRQMVNITPVIGRADDLLVFNTPAAKTAAYDVFKDEIMIKHSQLFAKWAPREKSSKGAIASELRKHMGLDAKAYRKLLSSLTKVVENKMCAGQWTDIEYSHVPSVAGARLQKAFGKHDPDGYSSFKEKLVTGEVKINSKALYPYDVLKSIRSGDQDVAKAQWDALENFIGDAKVLPVVDVSGSMCILVGGNKNLTCLDVSISLGLYCADKNTGPFKDCFLTFSTRSKIEVLRGDILAKYTQLIDADWDMTTNLNSAFEEILRVGKTNSVLEADMPKIVLILSDMEFDRCVTNADNTAYDMITSKYNESGYELPKVVFWNLNARSENVPVRFDTRGTALVSGFSPSILKSILGAKEFTPASIMLDTVNVSRYEVIV
jgi:hypothetical protein